MSHKKCIISLLVFIVISVLIGQIIYRQIMKNNQIAYGDMLCLYKQYDLTTGDEVGNALVIFDSQFHHQKYFQKIDGSYTDLVLQEIGRYGSIPKYALINTSTGDTASATYNLEEQNFFVDSSFNGDYMLDSPLNVYIGDKTSVISKPDYYQEIDDPTIIDDNYKYKLLDFEQIATY